MGTLDRRMRRHLLILLACAGLVAAALGACGSSGDGGNDDGGHGNKREPRPERVSAKDAASKPNVIFIYTDDQNVYDFKPKYMPQTFKLLKDQGTNFSDYIVATPLCCPSRAQYMTGNYPHNNGVFSNPSGYRNLKDKFNTLPVWMHNAGYRTAWVGKYLQGYDNYASNEFEAAPGIDDWHATFEPRYYDYDIADNGERVRKGDRSRDYYTTVVNKLAVDTVEQAAKGKRPLFMTLNNLAPHHGFGKGGRCTNIVPPAPRDVGLFKNAKVPRTPNFNEADTSDKPEAVVPYPPLKPERIKKLDLTAGCRQASLAAVDRGIADIYAAVKKAGELDNTVFMFTSDNGILQGQHRIGGKNVPYEDALLQPLVVLAGKKALGGPQVSDVSELTASVDLAPTILDFADAKPCARPGNCRKLDGASLIPLMRGRKPKSPFGPDRDVLVQGGKGGTDCGYSGIRTPDVNFTIHDTYKGGECTRGVGEELYDLTGELTGNADPYELDNLLSPVTPGHDSPEVKAEVKRLNSRLAELQDCSGRSCH